MLRMNDALIVTLLSVVPKGLGSRLQGLGARTGLSRQLIRWYAQRYGVNLEEMEGVPEDYATLQDFFVRPLKPGQRPIDPAPDALVSPCDARVYTFGTLTAQGQLPPEAGLPLDAHALVDDPSYAGGGFAVLYLSPRDYHRVHHPLDGQVIATRYLPGALWPVFPEATRRIPNLFAVNERVVVTVEHPAAGPVAVVLVGAYGVGRMSLSFDALVTNQGGAATARVYSPPLPARRGEELGRFNLGSTVILITRPGAVQWALERDAVVRVGQRIGTLAGVTPGSAPA